MVLGMPNNDAADDRPYTDEDLRAEATRQHAALVTDPDFMGIGEQMGDTEVDSLAPRYEPQDIDGQPNDADGPTWSDVCNRQQFTEAQHAIDDLLTNAADTSRWAIDLGADGLEPSDGHALTLMSDGEAFARILLAFAPDVPDEDRDGLAFGIAEAFGIAAALGARKKGPTSN